MRFFSILTKIRSGPGRNRTCDLRIRSPTPYPGLATGPTNYCIIKNVILSKNFIMSHILQHTH